VIAGGEPGGLLIASARRRALITVRASFHFPTATPSIAAIHAVDITEYRTSSTGCGMRS
jgi:hypothetical protein